MIPSIGLILMNHSYPFVKHPGPMEIYEIGSPKHKPNHTATSLKPDSSLIHSLPWRKWFKKIQRLRFLTKQIFSLNWNSCKNTAPGNIPNHEKTVTDNRSLRLWHAAVLSTKGRRGGVGERPGGWRGFSGARSYSPLAAQSLPLHSRNVWGVSVTRVAPRAERRSR